ncbi:MAG: RNA polymerase sigma factor [Bacteroidota bacterium]
MSILFNRYRKKTDEELMVLVKRRDHHAFSTLYKRYANRLNAFFFRMLWSDRELSEDFVHDLFARIISKPELYNEAYEVKPWLFRIAANMCKNAYRKRRLEEAFRAANEWEEASASPGMEKMDEVILTDQIYAVLDGMEEERKTLFLLRYQQELSIEAISKMLKLSEGTVKSRLFYTREKIKATLKY